MSQSYPRLPVEEFGRILVDSYDLDPIYLALHRLRLPVYSAEATWDRARMARWLVAYWCFYHAGVACYMAGLEDGQPYWSAMRVAAENKTPSPAGDRWPRAKERRHFRGQVCVDAVHELASRYPTAREMLAHALVGSTPDFDPSMPLTMELVSKRVREWPLFGPWIAFKVGDMLDRCLGVPVSFDSASVFMFKDPTEAALMVWREFKGYPEDARPKNAQVQQEVIDGVVAHVLASLEGRLAPPRNDRTCGLQEAETVLCKWKSHVRGHYPLYNDLDEIRDGLLPWAFCSPLAAQFLEHLPSKPIAR